MGEEVLIEMIGVATLVTEETVSETILATEEATAAMIVDSMTAVMIDVEEAGVEIDVMIGVTIDEMIADMMTAVMIDDHPEVEVVEDEILVNHLKRPHLFSSEISVIVLELMKLDACVIVMAKLRMFTFLKTFTLKSPEDLLSLSSTMPATPGHRVLLCNVSIYFTMS